MSLHRILADVQPLGDFAIAQPAGNELEDLEFARSNPEFVEARGVGNEGKGGSDVDGDLDLLHDNRDFGLRETEAEPDAEGGEDQCDDCPVDLERVFQDQVAILNRLKDRDEETGESAVEKDGTPHECYVGRKSSCRAARTPNE